MCLPRNCVKTKGTEGIWSNWYGFSHLLLLLHCRFPSPHSFADIQIEVEKKTNKNRNVNGKPAISFILIFIHFASNKLTFRKHFNVPWNWKGSSFVSVNIDFIICFGFSTQILVAHSQFFVICSLRLFATSYCLRLFYSTFFPSTTHIFVLTFASLCVCVWFVQSISCIIFNGKHSNETITIPRSGEGRQNKINTLNSLCVCVCCFVFIFALSLPFDFCMLNKMLRWELYWLLCLVVPCRAHFHSVPILTDAIEEHLLVIKCALMPKDVKFVCVMLTSYPFDIAFSTKSPQVSRYL